MTVSKFNLKVRYELFTRVVGMIATTLTTSNFKIRKPFDKLWERLENEDGATINISKFNKFCDDCETAIYTKIYSVNEDVEIDDKSENWTVYIFPKISKRARKDVFNALANEFLGYQDKNIHFGTSSSPLSFGELIQHFTEDEWDELYDKMGQASIVMQEKVEQEIIDMSQMCTIIGLSITGSSDELYNECKKIVIS